MEEQDAYNILHVTWNATDAEIRSAFCMLAFQFHPDHNREKSAESRFQEICEAYKVLKNCPIRAADRSGLAATEKDLRSRGHVQPAAALDRDLSRLIDLFNSKSANDGFASKIQLIVQSNPGHVGEVIRKLEYSKLVRCSGLRAALFSADPSTYIEVNLPACIRSFNRTFFGKSFEGELERFLDYKPELARLFMRELKLEKRAAAKVLDKKITSILQSRAPDSPRFFESRI